MVSFSTRFFISAIYLSTHVSYLLASGKCCEGDLHCSGCWMCPESDLRECWDPAVQEADACTQHTDLLQHLDCLCKVYSKVAHCWKQGRCCTEYAPTLAAATNLCNLQTWPESQLTKDIVQKVANDAHWVRNSIWNNNSGYNVPKLKVYVKAYSSEYSESSSTYHTQSTPTKTKHYTNSSSEVQSHDSNESWKNKENYQEKPKFELKTYSSEKGETNPKNKQVPVKTHEQRTHSEVHKHETNNKHTSSDSNSHIKVHHQATCSQHQHKCQHQVASQYHQARRQASSHSFNKRNQSPVHPRFAPHPKNAELYKRSEIFGSNGESKCGIDFQGVAYPLEVPESVSRVFATL